MNIIPNEFDPVAPDSGKYTGKHILLMFAIIVCCGFALLQREHGGQRLIGIGLAITLGIIGLHRLSWLGARSRHEFTFTHPLWQRHRSPAGRWIFTIMIMVSAPAIGLIGPAMALIPLGFMHVIDKPRAKSPLSA
jgi:hypothetical protein